MSEAHYKLLGELSAGVGPRLSAELVVELWSNVSKADD